MMGNTAGAES